MTAAERKGKLVIFVYGNSCFQTALSVLKRNQHRLMRVSAVSSLLFQLLLDTTCKLVSVIKTSEHGHCLGK